MRTAVLIFFIWISSINALAQTIQSPDGKLSLSFALTADGEPTYQLSFGRRPVLQKSKLGIELKDQPALTKGFSIVKADTSQTDETWQPVWGEVKRIRNHYKELSVTLQQTAYKNRRMIIRFRLLNDGLGFRYEVPEQTDLKYFIVSDEKTEFNLTGDHKTFWIPGDYDTNEYNYSTTQFIKDVAVDWDDTRILEAEPGDYLTIARKGKNKEEWYVGAITDEQARSVNISSSYLTPKRWYVATLYTDAANAHWEKNPMAFQIQRFLVNDQTMLKIALASGGGAAISLKPASSDDMKKFKRYENSR